MIVKGCVVNNSGRYKHIFKRTVRPGEKVQLKDLYKTYKNKCDCEFNYEFIAWLKENKIPEEGGWDLEFETAFDNKVRVTGRVVCVDDIPVKVQKGLTADDIANLKVKDAPKVVLQTIDSIPKLRRALTKAKRKKGKNFLIKYLKERIDILMKDCETSENIAKII
jgi:hypothetical protein